MGGFPKWIWAIVLLVGFAFLYEGGFIPGHLMTNIVRAGLLAAVLVGCITILKKK